MLLSVLLLASSFVFYFLLLKPAYLEVGNLRGLQLKTEEDLNNKRLIIQKVDDLIKKYQSIGVVREQISDAIPLDPDLARLMLQLSVFASKNNVDIQSLLFSISTVKDAPKPDITYGYGVIKTTLEVAGNYELLLAFLNDVESNVRLMDVRGISFSKVSTKDKEANIFSYKLEFDSYYQTTQLGKNSTQRTAVKTNATFK